MYTCFLRTEEAKYAAGLVAHALATAMRAIIKEYLVLNTQLEHQVSRSIGHTKSKYNLTNVGPLQVQFIAGSLTLQKLWFYVQPTFHTFQAMASLITTINNANQVSGLSNSQEVLIDSPGVCRNQHFKIKLHQVEKTKRKTSVESLALACCGSCEVNFQLNSLLAIKYSHSRKK
jgi:hypothetical protein